MVYPVSLFLEMGSTVLIAIILSCIYNNRMTNAVSKSG